MRKKFIITVALTLILGGGIFVSLNESNSQENIQSAGTENITRTEKFDQVPEFVLEDWNGNEVTLADFQGKPLILNSWAVWCPFCLDELPDFAQLQEELEDSVIIIAIDRAEPTAKQKKFTDKLGVTDRLLFLNDPKDSFYQSIGGFSMPETLFVDAEGNIRIHKRGPMDIGEMRQKVQSIL
ncbi:MAG: hypothetical protein CMI56_02910 [Parcubacteria group bacterium]|nr:hypothetical protein [Parcubacteria group bacterium]|tara:strand:+ start:687 stop:1232 length:546 start_codon:yes stop_codon:yes gene_type:complete